VSIGTALALAAATAGVLVGDLGGQGLLDLLPGTGWVAADSSVQRVNGMSGTIDGGIALTDDQGRPIEIIQEGDEVYFRTEDGTLARVEEATLGPGASVGLDPGTVVVENGGVAWFLEPAGDASGHDAVTLTPLGGPVDLGGPVPDTAAAVDGTGALFAAPGEDGEVALVDAVEGEEARHKVAEPGTALRLTRLDNAIVALDAKGRAVVEVRRDGVRPAIPLPGRGALLTSSVVAGEDLWVIDELDGLIKVDLRKGRAEAPIKLTPLPGEPEPPLVASGYVYVPAGDALITVDARTGERKRDVQLPPEAKVSVRNGLLIADGDGANLVVHQDVAVPIDDRESEELPEPIPPDLTPDPPEPDPPDPGQAPDGDDPPTPDPSGQDPGNGDPGGGDPGGGNDPGGGGGNPPTGAEETEPDPPRQPEAFPGDESAVVSWTTPAGDGGADITGYEVSYTDPSGADATLRVGADERSADIPNLDNGESYIFEIRAVNSVGPSDPATTSAITPTAEVPNPPTNANAAVAGARLLQISWAPPTGGTRTLDRFDVECASSGQPTLAASTPGDATGAQVAGATGGAAYTCTVRAVNDAGVTSTPAVAPDVVAQDRPSAPPATAYALEGGVRVVWGDPAPNGSEVTGFTIRLNGSPYSAAASSRQLDVGGLTRGSYTCSITVNSPTHGDSDQRSCDGDPRSLNRPPVANDDPADNYMGGFVWGPSDPNNPPKCLTSRSVLENDSDPDGIGGRSATMTAAPAAFGPVVAHPSGGYAAGWGNPSYVWMKADGTVELCATRIAARNVGTPMRLTYYVTDDEGRPSNAAEARFYLQCRDGANPPNTIAC
jgi:hypothetical protein